MELETIWTGAHDVAKARSQQWQPEHVKVVRTAIAKPGELMGRILGVMRLDPHSAWTATRVRAALAGEPDRGVRNGLARLVKRGDLTGWPEPWPCKHGYRMVYRVRLEAAA